MGGITWHSSLVESCNVCRVSSEMLILPNPICMWGDQSHTPENYAVLKMRVRDQLAWNRINSSYLWVTMYESLKWSTLMASFGNKNIYISIIFQNYYMRPEEVLLPGLWLMILSWNCIIRMNSSGHQEKKKILSGMALDLYRLGV